MTTNEKEQILTLQSQGLGYTKISEIVGLPANSIKTFLRRAEIKRSEATAERCLCCQKPIKQTPHHRKKRFCSAVCRMRWWNANQQLVKRNAYYDFVCPYCGKAFTAYGNDHRVYCSRKCYADARRKNGKLSEHFDV